MPQKLEERKLNKYINISRNTEDLNNIYIKLQRKGINSLNAKELSLILQSFTGRILDIDSTKYSDIFDMAMDAGVIISAGEMNSLENLRVAVKRIKEIYDIVK